MRVEEVLDMLDELLDQSWALPLSAGRCVVDAEKVRDLIDDIRINMPSEISQARAIVNDREEIIATAKREAQGIVRKAEERAKALIANEEITRQAQSRAHEVLTQTQMQVREIRAAAQSFSDNALREAEEALQRSLVSIKTTRHDLRNKQKK